MEGRRVTRELHVVVHGRPAPQGSKNSYGRNVVEASKQLMPWREAVKWAALKATALGAAWEPLAGPLSLDVTFHLPRPASAPKRRWSPDRQPDLDKLLRSLDALTEVNVWLDDAQVIDVTARKRYADHRRGPGADIHVWEVTC